MKKTFLCVLAVLLCCFVGCDNLANSGNDKEDIQITITSGWYEYTTQIKDTSGYYYKQTTYFFINTNGYIERAGSNSYEYFGTELEKIQNQLSWSICNNLANNSNGAIIFKITDAPVWADLSENEPEKKCPYDEGEYLDIVKLYETHNVTYIETTWAINKNIPLWTYYNGTVEYTASCSDVYGYININNIFVIGKDLKQGDSLTITAYFDFTKVEVRITFTEPIFDESSSDSNPPQTLLPTGYEWWCFEDAIVGEYYFYVLYDNEGKASRMGFASSEISNIDNYSLYKDKKLAVENYLGTKYQISDLTKLPSWAIM